MLVNLQKDKQAVKKIIMMDLLKKIIKCTDCVIGKVGAGHEGAQGEESSKAIHLNKTDKDSLKCVFPPPK